MNALERLRYKMSNMIVERPKSSPWGQPQLMTKALTDVKKAFDAPTSDLPERSIANALEGYRRTGNLHDFRDLRYICLGVGQGLKDGWCLFDDDPLFANLLKKVKDLWSEPRRFRKCYQGLLSSYFSYPIFHSKSQKNWKHLRKYLADCLPSAMKALPVAGWLTLLEEHQNLLGPNPCERYVQELREGNKDAVHQTLHDGLGVPRESWVLQELVLSQVQVACNHDDQHYKDDLEQLLRMFQGDSTLSKNLVIRCIAMLLSRYVQCSSKPEHPALRDAAVTHIGNPWLKVTAWDAHVKTQDGQPHEEARLMVNGWIKRRLIKDFFELLSDDGSADQRRLNYWLRFEPVIEDMWFALGPHAISHPSTGFKDFRNRAEGRLLKLEKPGGSRNNAFILRLGPVTAVEFGLKGNATYMYQSDELPFDLSKSWVSGDSSGLKNQKMGTRFSHRDSERAGTNWEEKLDAILCPLIGFRPTLNQLTLRRSASSSQSGTTSIKPVYSAPPVISTWEREVKELSERYGLPTIDGRPGGGAFWVMINSPNWPELAKFGFQFKPGKGWYRE